MNIQNQTANEIFLSMNDAQRQDMKRLVGIIFDMTAEEVPAAPVQGPPTSGATPADKAKAEAHAAKSEGNDPTPAAMKAATLAAIAAVSEKRGKEWLDMKAFSRAVDTIGGFKLVTKGTDKEKAKRKQMKRDALATLVAEGAIRADDRTWAMLA